MLAQQGGVSETLSPGIEVRLVAQFLPQRFLILADLGWRDDNDFGIEVAIGFAVFVGQAFATEAEFGYPVITAAEAGATVELK